MIDLTPFCSTDRRRPNMQHPWSRGDWTYATNGHIMIRLPRSSGVAENGEAPNAEKIFDQVASQSETLPLPKFKMPRLKTEECVSCDGRGFAHDCPYCHCECESCDGAGSATEKASIELFGANYDVKYIKLIRDLPKSEFSCWPPPLDAPARFVFNGGDGALMPLRKVYKRHIKTGAIADIDASHSCGDAG
jgi:hypothetical protein